MTFTGLLMLASGFLLVTLAIVPQVTRLVRSQPPGTKWLAALAKRTPVYYGWVVFAIASSTSYAARPVMSAATLSVFVVPMTTYFGWSRGLFAGAFSLGGLCAVVVMPLAGRLIDRYGSGAVIAAGSAVAGCSAMALALVGQVWAFYLVYVPGRVVFSSVLELGPSTVVSNWFIQHRPVSLALLSISQGIGLAVMPLAAQWMIGGWSWQTAWVCLGAYTLAIGVVPPLLFMARRPEDLGLQVDPVRHDAGSSRGSPSRTPSPAAADSIEASYTVRQALRTRAFWALAIYAGASFMAQAGVSLHLASHYINQGLPGSSAALTVSAFAIAQIVTSYLWSKLTSWLPARILLAMAGFSLGIGSLAVASTASLEAGLIASWFVGTGVSGATLLLRLTCANYYGRQNLGSITGLILSVQTAGQAMGPVVAGFIFDFTQSYLASFTFFAVTATLSGFLVLSATPPDTDGGRDNPEEAAMP